MASAPAASREQRWLSNLLTTDFCPWANRFVYWLKEPIGWFVLAFVASIMIGLYFSPIGWTLAAALLAIILAGMVWPYFAVRVTRCQLHPQIDAVHEDDHCKVILSVRNRLPMPVWGLAIEGYLDGEPAGDNAPTVGLASVPALCTAGYSVDLRPAIRGHYPIAMPHVACSFPFGIWTARRGIEDVRPLTVWPKLYRMRGRFSLQGAAMADDGSGERGGVSGDYVGVRGHRRGDSAKQINWIASERSGALIVTERGGPQTVVLSVHVDARLVGDRIALTRRMRVAASILDSLHHTRIATSVWIGGQRLNYGLHPSGRRRMLDALASVPIDGIDCGEDHWETNHAGVTITGRSDGSIHVNIINPRSGRRAGGSIREVVIGPHEDLESATMNLWREVCDADIAA